MLAGIPRYIYRYSLYSAAAYFKSGRYLHACKTSSNTLNPPLASPHATLPTNQASADILPSPNIKQYSKSVFLYNDPSIPGSFRSSRPLLLLLPWLGAKAHSYKKYVQLYFKLGFDVLVAESSLSHFLWPKRGLVYAGDLLELLVREKDLSSRTLFVHAISIGGYIFAQMLVRSSNGHEAQREMLAGIHGQVFDSLVVGSLEKMATGVARMISYPLLQTVVVRGTLLYFSLLKAQTADYYEKGIQTFWESPIRCPALFFYSMDDPLSDHIMVEQLLMDWEKQGIRVQGKRWDSSIHAGHLQRHPQEYTETLNSFICSLKSDSPKCKL
ncbi:transmembrane protein 53-like isoform 2-T2 [Rhinophrynus dorsalis]